MCHDCNHYFSKDLELPFARETGESIVRFQHGLRDKIAAFPGGRLTARVKVPGPIFGAKVLLGPNAARNGIDIIYLPQVAFKTKDSEEWTWYLEDELCPEAVRSIGPGSCLKYFVTSSAERARLTARVRALGVTDTQDVGSEIISPQLDVTTRVTYLFDDIIRRCVAKIAFNYLAYALLEDTWLLLRNDFDAIRSYVRDGTILGPELVFVSGSPKLTAESRKGAFVDGHMIAVGWDVNNESIFCNLSIFNAVAYQVILCREYRGLWFPLGSLHSFDLAIKKATKLPFNILVRNGC